MLLLLTKALYAAPTDLGRQVVIVYNEQEPESRALAEYYAGRRGVPTNQLCAIRVRNAETITRREYEEQVERPIGEFLTDRNLWRQAPRRATGDLLDRRPGLETVENRISYLALVYGVPLRIEHDPNRDRPTGGNETAVTFRRNRAAVDSELALLPSAGHPIAGAVPNPVYGALLPRFESPWNQRLLLVGRLDGPDPATVRRMIDDALRSERVGLQGRVVIDLQNTRDPGYRVGDEWLRAAAATLQAAGYDCQIDERPEPISTNTPLSAVAIYAGWYAGQVTGPFAQEDFRFMPGAVAVHIHSTSAASLRTRIAHWAGPLLVHGAATTLGNVFEPFLPMTPHLDKFFAALVDGHTFLEAAYRSQPVLSWQTTFVGDPLYRPFAVSLAGQVERLEQDREKDPDSALLLAWAYVRQVNVLAAQGKRAQAEQLCRVQADRLGSPVLRAKLAELEKDDIPSLTDP
ncbi:TIGR03790 family protein [bacterium]|nr:TIGR03790 family protein [bacterium]